MKMVELVEIYSKSSEYDANLKNVRTEHGLRKIYVNPACVPHMRENNGFKIKQAHEGSALESLNERTEFTRLSFTSQGTSSVAVNVVGDVATVAKKLSVG